MQIAHADVTSAANVYYGCIKKVSIKYAKSQEPAESIAVAAQSSCIDEQDNYLKSLPQYGDLSASGIQQIAAKMQSNGRQLSIKTVMDERIK